MDASSANRARVVVDAWNGQAIAPIKDLRYPTLSEAAKITDLSTEDIVAAEAASYRVELSLRTERRKGANPPKRAFDASTLEDAKRRLPLFRPIPTRVGVAATIVEPDEHLVDVETETCHPCRGSGKVACATCHGSRQHLCLSCMGAGQTSQRRKVQVTCSRCNGVGQFGVTNCSTCDRRGWTPCPGCEPDGYVRTRARPLEGKPGLVLTEHQCATCAGTHRRTCTQCLGYGQVGIPCPPTVVVEQDFAVPCPTCRTTGKVDCNMCAATGSLQCHDCGGFGTYYQCTLAHRIVTVAPLGEWRSGPNADLASASWLATQLESKQGGQAFEVKDGDYGEVVTALTAVRAPFLDELQSILSRPAGGADDAVLVSTSTVPSIAFKASLGEWNARYLAPAGGPIFANTAVAPIDPEQVRLREVAYAAWRPRELVRLENAHQGALSVAAGHRQKAEAAALRARPWKRVAVVALVVYLVAVAVAWYIIVQVGIPLASTSGLPRRLDPFYGWAIVALGVVIPVVVLRNRLKRLLLSGLASFRTHVPPTVADPVKGDLPAETVPADWAPSEHQIDFDAAPADDTAAADDSAAAA